MKDIKFKAVYIFFRGETFYPLELKDDNDAIINAETNPGTTKVTDKDGRIIWPINQTIDSTTIK